MIGAKSTGSQTSVSIVRLKQFVRDKSGEDLLAQVILAERDELTATEFLAKLETWLILAKEGSAKFR